MVVNRIFKLGIVVVFIFILLTGFATSAQTKEKTTTDTEMNQTMNQTTNQTRTYEETGETSQTHTIVLMNYEFIPETTEANQSDTVRWRNLNKPKRTFVLVSEDKLWEDFSLGYGKVFEYTFNETGTFAFSIEGEKDLKGTVVVGESRETAGVPVTEKETLQIQEEEREGQEEEEVITPSPTEEVTPTPVIEQVQIAENSVLIRGSVFYPETLELNKGETLVWKNLNKPKRAFTLVSEENLFDDQIISYGKSFSYTFDKAGDYTFKLEEIPETELTVTVI